MSIIHEFVGSIGAIGEVLCPSRLRDGAERDEQ